MPKKTKRKKTKRKKTKTEIWLRSVRNSKIGYFLPTPGEYNKMSVEARRVYTNIMMDYKRESGFRFYKDRALYKAIDYAQDPKSELRQGKRTRIKNLFNRVNDIRERQNRANLEKFGKRVGAPVNDKALFRREKRRYGYSKSEEAYKRYLTLQTGKIIRSIPKKSFNDDNLEIRAAGRYLYGYEPLENPQMVYLVRFRDNNELYKVYSLSMKQEVDKMIAKHNRNVSKEKKEKRGNPRIMAENEASVIFNNFKN